MSRSSKVAVPKGCRLVGPTPGPYQAPKNNSILHKLCPQITEKSEVVQLAAAGKRSSKPSVGTQWIGETNVAGHKFWFSKKKGSGLQQFVFNQADQRKHRVCVVLGH